MFALPGLLLLSAAFVLASADPPSSATAQRFKQDVESCKALNPVTDETLANLNRNGALLDENDQDARCFVVCMMQKGELVDAGGTFSAAKAKQYVVQRVPVLYGPPGSRRPDQEAVNAAVDQCAATSEEGKCMTNYKIWTCLYTKLHTS